MTPSFILIYASLNTTQSQSYNHGLKKKSETRSISGSLCQIENGVMFTEHIQGAIQLRELLFCWSEVSELEVWMKAPWMRDVQISEMHVFAEDHQNVLGFWYRDQIKLKIQRVNEATIWYTKLCRAIAVWILQVHPGSPFLDLFSSTVDYRRCFLRNRLRISLSVYRLCKSSVK